MLTELGSVRLKDLEIFLEVVRAKSIREAARRVGLTSGQVSKTVQSLEARLSVKLFRRSVSGVLLTSQGTEIKRLVQELIFSGEKIETLLAGKESTSLTRTIAIAGTSFLNTHFITPTVCRNAKLWPETIFRFLDVAPDQIIPIGLRGGFEMAAHFGSLAWPGTWTTASLGKSSWILAARNGHPLPKRSSLRQVLEYPFVVPTYWTSEGLVRGNDQFPVTLSKRIAGFETATADAAIPILLQTNQIAFLPALLVLPWIRNKKLREIQVPDIPK